MVERKEDAMNCPLCGCFIEPKLDIRSLLAAIAITALISFIGGIFFYDWKLVPKFEQKIQKDGEIKKELEKGFIPSRPEIRKK